jgi:hypothetical protein
VYPPPGPGAGRVGTAGIYGAGAGGPGSYVSAGSLLAPPGAFAQARGMSQPNNYKRKGVSIDQKQGARSGPGDPPNKRRKANSATGPGTTTASESKSECVSKSSVGGSKKKQKVNASKSDSNKPLAVFGDTPEERRARAAVM